MLKKILAASAIALLAIAPAAPGARAQSIHVKVDVRDPTTGLSPEDWDTLMSQAVHPNAVIGEPMVVVISSLNVPITLTCDRWTMVGPNPDDSVAGNPAEIAPFSITPIKTKSFDGYCKEGVTGHLPDGTTLTAALTSSDGTFTNATVLRFKGHTPH